MEQLMQEITSSLISLIALAVLAAMTELRSRVLRWIDSRKSAAEREILHKLAEEGFAFVESSMNKASSSNKIAAASEYVSRQLKSRKINLESDEIRAAIEMFVTSYNKHRK